MLLQLNQIFYYDVNLMIDKLIIFYEIICFVYNTKYFIKNVKDNS